jgi:hypothetical protein
MKNYLDHRRGLSHPGFFMLLSTDFIEKERLPVFTVHPINLPTSQSYYYLG